MNVIVSPLTQRDSLSVSKVRLFPASRLAKVAEQLILLNSASAFVMLAGYWLLLVVISLKKGPEADESVCKD